jgi:phage terminase large subunit
VKYGGAARRWGLADEAAFEAPKPPRGGVMVRYQRDPEGFVRDVLGVRLWGRQLDVLRAVAASRRARVAVRSGHKVGKSRVVVCLALWFACCFPDARVVLTSASFRQVRGILWRELKRLYRGARVPLGGELHKAPDNGLEWDDGREIKGFTTDDPERMAGISGENVLFILDEASGIAQDIFDAIEGNRAGGARLVMTSNPTKTTGEFFDAFHSKRHLYTCIHISSLESPNVAANDNAIPGLATKEWCDEKLAEWGEDSPLYQVRVLGNFPKQGSDAVIALAAVEEARKRWDDAANDNDLDDDEPRRPYIGPQHGRLHLGVDVARFGDDESTVYARRGRFIVDYEVVHGMDTQALAELVERVAARHWQEGEKDLPLVKVDTIGVGGGVADKLRRNQRLRVVDIVVSETSDDEEKYSRLRDQLWFGLADWLKTGAIPADGKLEGELVSPTYGFDERGRRKVVSKDKIKAKLGRSPDRAEGLMLSVYEGGEATDGDVGSVVEDDEQRWEEDARGYG